MLPKVIGTAQARYQKMTEGRQQFLDRGRHNALLTIPSLLTLEGHNGKNHLIEPYQGMGSAGVTHLSSRMVSRMLPAGRPYMRLALPTEALMQLGGEVPEDLERGLALSEQLIQTEVETADWRTSTLMALQQLLVAGNVAEHHMLNNVIRLFRLDQYVVARDYAGAPLEAIIEEILTRDTLPTGMPVPERNKSENSEDEEVRLYTWIKRMNKAGGDVFSVHQEIDNRQVGKTLEFALAELPYNFLRWSSTPGEDYGRAKVEEHIADLRSLDTLEKGVLEFAAMSSRHFTLVAPGATAMGLKNRLSTAANGAVLMGDPDSVGMVTFESPQGFQITTAVVERLVGNIARAFLLQSAGQRDAERVTATEIERDILEIEAALGGNFSSLNTQMMERRTNQLIRNMVAAGKLPPEIAETNPQVLTGLEALSRERDVQRVRAVADIIQAFGEQAVDVIKLEKVIARATIGLGFPDVVRTADEIKEIQSQRQQQEALQNVVGPLAQAAAKEGQG